MRKVIRVLIRVGLFYLLKKLKLYFEIILKYCTSKEATNILDNIIVLGTSSFVFSFQNYLIRFKAEYSILMFRYVSSGGSRISQTGAPIPMI